MKYHIITFGCQMNKNDSERIARFLEESNLREGKEEEADLIIVNACSVRQSAVDRIRGKIENIKKRDDDPTTILTGCVLDEDKPEIGAKFDYVLSIKDLPKWPLPFLKKKEREYLHIEPKRKGPSAYISIMTGCNNFCTYCVVPYTRGEPVSRSHENVIEETKSAIKEGCKEIWLLGQNVNAYQGGVSFPELLRMVNNIKGDFWIRFTSSHPKDFSDELIKTMKECGKVAKHLNLPIQSGDNEILKKMNRPYTVEQYKDLVNRIMEVIPGISLSTDIIVGFPGERERHFRNTVKLFNEIPFDMAHIARYSPRPQTAAYELGDTVSEEEKKRREKLLEELLKERNREKNKQYKGETIKVLVMGRTKKGMLTGKTEKNKTVLFKGKKELVGKFVKVKITEYLSWALKGQISPE